jgi:hypothetical protein
VVAKLPSKLSLSDVQQAKIRPIIAARQQRLPGVSADQFGGHFQERAKMKSIFERATRKSKQFSLMIRKQKYEEIEEEMREQNEGTQVTIQEQFRVVNRLRRT